jgi:hypothetical protein
MAVDVSERHALSVLIDEARLGRLEIEPRQYAALHTRHRPRRRVRARHAHTEQCERYESYDDDSTRDDAPHAVTTQPLDLGTKRLSP